MFLFMDKSVIVLKIFQLHIYSPKDTDEIMEDPWILRSGRVTSISSFYIHGAMFLLPDWVLS